MKQKTGGDGRGLGLTETVVAARLQIAAIRVNCIFAVFLGRVERGWLVGFLKSLLVVAVEWAVVRLGSSLGDLDMLLFHGCVDADEKSRPYKGNLGASL